MSEYKYPKGLVDLLENYSSEGYEIFTTHNEDSTVFIIIPVGLGRWVIIIEWYFEDEYSIVNINKTSFNRLHKAIHEIESE